MGRKQRCYAEYDPEFWVIPFVFLPIWCGYRTRVVMGPMSNFLVCFCTGSDEQKFLEAAMAYVAGKPILSDEEYDKLKLKLKVSPS